jgi:hypothetical protein
MEHKFKGVNFKPTNNFKYPIVLKGQKLYVEVFPEIFTEARMIAAFKRQGDGLPGVRFVWAGKVYDVMINQMQIAV